MHEPITPLKNHETFCFTCSPGGGMLQCLLPGI